MDKITIIRNAGPTATVRIKGTENDRTLWALSFDDGYHTCWYTNMDRAMRAGAAYLKRIGAI